MKKVLNRNEVKTEETWDLSRLYQTEEMFDKDVLKLEKLVNDFVDKYENKINNENILIESIIDYEEIVKLFTYTNTFVSLHLSVDQRNALNQERSGKHSIISHNLNNKLVFYDLELLNLDESIINKAIKLNETYKPYLKELLEDQKHKLNNDVTKALSMFSRTLNASYKNYNNFKLADMDFKTFEALGKSHSMSFTLFENEYQYDTNHELRRNAFNHFYDVLKTYQNGFASNYEAHLLKEKTYSELKKYKTVTDYLLSNQKVSLDMYNRQIDLIMNHLSKPMQKYANIIKEIYNLDEMTYADLHLAIDPTYEPEVSIKEARDYAIDALSVFGNEYQELTKNAFDERWIDFPQNLGKSTGGFCSSPYQKGSYILLNWNNQMNEVFVLAHEIGHAGHFHFASHNQTVLNTRPSMYFIEAPSTMNELIMANYLSKQKEDLRFRRWVLSNIVSRTYYHNFVTHLLEAAFQREIYNLIDEGKPINAFVLNNTKLKVIKDFWQDSVTIPDYAGLTWMRQPHYFMGLYPYTYSAGLTISTTAFKMIERDELKYSDFINVLKAGGTKNPLELAKMINIDLGTEKPLMETIEYISDIIDEIVEITNELKR